MSTHRRIEVLCAVCALVACLICVAMLGLRHATGSDGSTGQEMGYEQRLFDTSKVHTIDIVMNDWDTFIENCENEEYVPCNVVIDGESYKNVAIRAKGNTSLSNVKQLGSQRYSFKIEFNEYESGKTYHGLNNLSLNNMIQDNTYMKDYLTYTMMREFGVDSPLSSYANITVNGEEWGLYLAVESVSDSFLERVYGNDTGDLYKPDRLSFGGDGFGNFGGKRSSDVKLRYVDDDPDSYPNIFGNAKTDVTNADKKRLIESLRKLSGYEDLDEVLDMDEVLRYFVVHDYVCNGDSYTGSMVHNYYLRESDGKLSMIPWDYNLAFGGFAGGDATTVVNAPIDDPTSSGMGFGRQSRRGQEQGSDENAQATEENASPEGAQRPTSDVRSDASDASGDMSQMPGGGMPEGMTAPAGMTPPEGMEMPSGMTPPEGMSMPEGMTPPSGMTMPEGMTPPEGMGSSDEATPTEGVETPSGDATPSFVGQASPFGGGTTSANSDSRPMVDWIFSDEQYTQRYHELYQQFLNEVDIQSIIDETEALIAPYVEQDPTKFCTYDEFLTAVDTLRTFCELRSQSVQGQLNGTIPSTEEGQQADSSALVDASSITISDMGSMGNNGRGGSQQGMGQKPSGTGDDTSDSSANSDSSSQTNRGDMPVGGFTPPSGGGFSPPSGDGSGNFSPPSGDNFGGFSPPTGGDFSPPEGMSFEGSAAPSVGGSPQSLIMLAACVVVLACGIGVTFSFRRD